MARRSVLSALCLFVGTARGFGFTVPAGGKECFDERASASDHMQGQWSVKLDLRQWTEQQAAAGDKGSLSGWRVVVTSPSGDLVYSVDAERQGSFDYYATVEGTYSICFSNGHPEAAAQAMAKITVGDPPDLIQLAKTEHLSPIEERIKNLHESMNAVRDLQDQMREQDETQAKMTTSTRKWLLYFTLIEAVVLVGVTAWQNLYLKSFFEVKRVV